jgi:alpha-L-rhamnosidase
VQVWDKNDDASKWSEPSHWQIGLLSPEDCKSDWIAIRDETPVNADRKKLNLLAARYYRKDFVSSKPIRQASVYALALGN